MIGNDVIRPMKPVMSVAALPVAPAPAVVAEPRQYTSAEPQQYTAEPEQPVKPPHKRLVDFAHDHSFVIFTLLFLMIAAAGTQIAGDYWGHRIMKVIPHAARPAVTVRPIAGLNLTVPDSELETRLKTITTQPATITVGDQTKQLSPDVIKSWLQVTPDKSRGVDYIHISANAISKSLKKVANGYVKAPVNQVVTIHDGVTTVIVAGRNGTQLTDPSSLDTQAQQLAKNVLAGQGGLQFSTPMQTLAASSVTPAAFHKLIEVNIVSKQMWLYEDGNLIKNYPISAGAPATPTPVGQFKIYSKFATQDMRGYNANGTKYFQPHVHWINYFLPGGYAVHGVYWHGSSWFGNINSSHGCVGLPDYQAKEVYDWAPIGTTVITHR